MFLIDNVLRWSATDLTVAADCEYATLRTLDYKLGWAARIDAPDDPLQAHIGRLGDLHEARILRARQAVGRVAVMPHVEAPYSVVKLEAAALATRNAFDDAPDVVFQASFLDPEFFGYADFVERTDDGWLVCDAKIARSAKPKALLQLGAYADQIARLGIPLAPRVSLLLGSGERVDFPTDDVLPMFVERRDRMRNLLAEHRAEGRPVEWGDDRYIACGHCGECAAAVERTGDVVLVAGLRMEQRRRLRAAGILTIGDLASATTRPDGMTQATFEKLHAQAVLQWRQLQAGEGAAVEFELTDAAPKMLAALPAPSPGDLFFDFEGDPMYDEGDAGRVGLEYLWGVLDTDGRYTPIWAHSWSDERSAFETFMDLVAARRGAHPDMHVYHYAPYETTALKRLAMRNQTREDELDALLRSDVFVDLYATVRGAIRVSQSSYSIKKLEPLYMGDLLRTSDVADGAGSIVAYTEYRELRDHDPSGAAQNLDALANYNEYDCLSTLRLRDWLLERAADAGVADLIVPRVRAVTDTEELSEHDPLFLTLVAKSGSGQGADRSPEQRAYAMLATALDYYRRERKQYWWEHFERLSHLAVHWNDARDVFVVESAEVVSDWVSPSRGRSNARRVLRLVGDWNPGSRPGSKAKVVYATPAPMDAFGPDGAPYAADDAERVELDPHDPRVVLLTESRNPGKTFADLPVALVPDQPPHARSIEVAIRAVAEEAAAASSLPDRGVLDILLRRAPRLVGPADLTGGVVVDGVVSALVAMTDSYVAIQGPPGTGKTHDGSRVIKELVEKHNWRIGVVAQSHAVVENMLQAIVDAGLEPSWIGKAKTETETPAWIALKDTKAVVGFLAERHDTGCVLGGTAWDFTNQNRVEPGSFDLLVIDEAGQFALATTLGVCVAARRLLLLGDPQQLPQVSQAVHAEPVDVSALGWLMTGHDTIPADLGFFLGQSYRMHPDLCAKVSVLSYEGQLHSAPSAAARSLEGVAPGLRVVTVDHSGNRVESPEEAQVVVEQVRSLLGALWTDPRDMTTPRPLDQADFLVVAPYNAQVERIRRSLNSAGLTEVRVGTVDKFQGQEAPVAIVSMTASSHGDVPRGMGFLLSRNRVNVAVSRAQWLAVLIRSESLTSFMPTSTQGVLELGAFIGLCRADAHAD